MYDAVQWAAGRSERAVIGASVILISGCQDNQLSADGDENGLFTQTLLDVWQNGGFQGDYPSFHAAIKQQMPGSQTPNYYKVGAANAEFEAEKPFTVGAGQVPATTTGPSITAEADPLPRDGGAPRFQVSTGSNPYYIVEVASDHQLFVDRPDGNTSQFYATYYDQDSPNRETGSSYTLPEHAWEALRSADRLYDRVGTTSTENSWDDYTVSTDDGTEPPSFGISAAQGGVEEPTSLDLPMIIAENDTVSSDGDAPRFQVSTGTNWYYIVEIAADYNLFVDRPDGNTEEFYATYYDQDSPNRETGNSYAMPDHAWEALRHAERLYLPNRYDKHRDRMGGLRGLHG